MSIYTMHDLIKQREKERINGNFREDYRIELYERYTGKSRACKVGKVVKVAKVEKLPESRKSPKSKVGHFLFV